MSSTDVKPTSFVASRTDNADEAWQGFLAAITAEGATRVGLDVRGRGTGFTVALASNEHAFVLDGMAAPGMVTVLLDWLDATTLGVWAWRANTVARKLLSLTGRELRRPLWCGRLVIEASEPAFEREKLPWFGGDLDKWFFETHELPIVSEGFVAEWSERAATMVDVAPITGGGLEWLDDAVWWTRLAGSDVLPGVLVGLAKSALIGTRLFDMLPEKGGVALTLQSNAVWAYGTPLRGLRVDVDRLDATIAAYESRLAQISQAFFGGVPVWSKTAQNVAATRQALEGYGFTIPDGAREFSKKVRAAMTVPAGAEEVWAAFSEAHELVAPLSTLRQQVRGSLVDDRLYPTHNELGTVTGRTTFTSPGVQTFDDVAKSMILADPGHVLVSVDLRNIEPRILASKSGDTTIGEAEDVYELVAEMAGVSRDIAKIILNGQSYGQGIAGLAATLGRSHQEARELVAKIHATFPDIFAYIDRLKAEHDPVRCHVNTVTGRPVIQAEHARDAVNRLIQSSAADILRNLLIDVHKEVSDGGGRVLLTIFDELLVQVRSELVDDFEQRVKSILSGYSLENDVPVLAKIKVLGERWG